MALQFEKFDNGKLERLKAHLNTCNSQGKPKAFEIWVDNLKVVPKTTTVRDFNTYEKFVNNDSQQIKVVIYTSATSHRNDQFVFHLTATNSEQAVTLGLLNTPVKTFSPRDISSWRQKAVEESKDQRQIKELQDEISGLEEELQDREDEIADLQQQLEVANAKGGTLGGIDLGKIVASGAEHLIRNTTHLWGKWPGLDGIAGIVEADSKNKTTNAPQPAQTEDVEVTFKKKETPATGIILTDQEKEFLAFFKQIQRHFSQQELEQLITIIDLLSKDKSLLIEVLELLTDDGGEQQSPKQ